ALEITMSGPSLRFNRDAVVVVTGAHLSVLLDDVEQPLNTTLFAAAGSTLALGTIRGAGARAYLCVRGGFDVAVYLGSRATFTLGQFGGHGGRALRLGDVLHLGESDSESAIGNAMPQTLIPIYNNTWEIGVIYGPHGAPDFFTDEDIAMLFSTDWKVHFNSNRTGVRLVGPKPKW